MASMEKQTPTRGKKRQSIARGAVTVMAAFIVSNLVGLLAKTLTARYFGTSVESNAFFAANRFSEILFNLVAGGALGSAFIPVFTGLLVKEERRRAWHLASALVNIVTLVLVISSVLTLLFSKTVVRYILAPGFTPPEVDLTARLLRIQVLSSIIFGLSGLAMGILNAHQHFLLPSLAPAMYQVGWLIGIFILRPALGVDGLAWGVVIGSALHLLVQVPRLLKLPSAKYRFSFGKGIAEVKEVALLMAPRLLGVAIVQLNFLLNTYLASFQPQGSITALSLAFPLMIMPEAAIAQSIAIAALPAFSALVAKGDLEKLRSSLAATLRSMLLLSIPATIGLIMLRDNIVRLLYQGNAFTNDSAALVSWALLWYAAGLAGHGLVEILSRAFYSLHDTKTPVVVGVGAMTANLLLSFAFTRLFASLGWLPHGGLALANSTATFAESIILIWIMRARLGGIESRSLFRSVLKSMVAAAVMGGAIWSITGLLAGRSNVAVTALSIVTGMLVYLVTLWMLRSRDFIKLLAIFKLKLKRIKET